MTTLEHLLTLLTEECAETAAMASKCIRFTLEEVRPDQEFTNKERLIQEFNDIFAIMEILRSQGYIGPFLDRKMIDAKIEKVKRYMEYSTQLGALKDQTSEHGL